MTDTGSRMERQQAFVPEAPRRILSDEAMQYVNLAAKLRLEAQVDPVCNGSDALERGHQGADMSCNGWIRRRHDRTGGVHLAGADGLLAAAVHADVGRAPTSV